MIYWDNVISQWKVSASTPTTYVITNSNPTYPPIYGGWFIIGGTGSVIVYEGPCNEGLISEMKFSESSPFSIEKPQPLVITTTKNQTICGCDGGITVSTKGGTPPYSYSINGGLTFRNIPIFTNLCSGTYNLIVSDSDGKIVK